MIRVVNLIIVFWCVCYSSIGDISASEPPSDSLPKCGWETCHQTKGDKINIHLVPHTHDDVGGLRTTDQYFYGSNKMGPPIGVRYILDSVISELAKNTDRRFVYVETAYLWRWWAELSEDDKILVKKLVGEGRLEFASGGWCMSDEATPHYTALIDQMTMGLQFLNETFGNCGQPKVAWQVDSYGHSSEVGIEFAEMGFNGLFVGRIDFSEFRDRREKKNLELVWRPDPSLGEAGELFVSVLFNLYQPPYGFCFDNGIANACADDPIMDNKKLHGYNLEDKIASFEQYMEGYAAAYKTNNVLVTMGSDFAYSAAASWFRNMDKLIKHINAKDKSRFNLIYSTPSCYLKALADQNTDWPLKEDEDFLPYGSDEHSYWTGYYTSRPTFKYFVYLANNILQATKQIATVLGTNSNSTETEYEFRRAVAMVHHHDALSGTERQHVVSDYSMYLQEGINKGQQIFSEVYKKFYGSDYPEQVFGNLRNISQFKLVEVHENFVITIYNPLSRNKTVPVKFPFVNDFHYEVFNRFGRLVTFDLVPLAPNLIRLAGRRSNATHDLVFMAEDLPAMGFASFYVRATQAALAGFDTLLEERPLIDSIVVIKNERVQLIFNKTDGLLTSFIKNNVTIPFRQNFFWYKPMRGFNYDATSRASGAYVFRPTDQKAKMEYAKATITEFRGKNVFEIHQKFSNWLSQVVRLYANSDDIEFEWLVGPLPQNETQGMEIVSRFSTDIASKSTFYTDSNGHRLMRRTRSSSKMEPVSGNYYPVTTSISIRDQTRQMTVITDRPQGGSSLQDGEVELMIHRRTIFDDGKGVNEPLDEMAFGEGLVVRGTHIVQFNDVAVATDAHRLAMTETAFHPIPSFGKISLDLKGWLAQYNTSFSLLNATLPQNIRVLTLERMRPNELLLRLEHIFEHDDRSTFVRSETVDLKNLLNNRIITVTGVRELGLGGNIEKEKLNRIKWKTSGQTTQNYGADPSIDKVILHPMQIRTFLLTVAYTQQFHPTGIKNLNF